MHWRTRPDAGQRAIEQAGARIAARFVLVIPHYPRMHGTRRNKTHRSKEKTQLRSTGAASRTPAHHCATPLPDSTAADTRTRTRPRRTRSRSNGDRHPTRACPAVPFNHAASRARSNPQLRRRIHQHVVFTGLVIDPHGALLGHGFQLTLQLTHQQPHARRGSRRCRGRSRHRRAPATAAAAETRVAHHVRYRRRPSCWALPRCNRCRAGSRG